MGAIDVLIMNLAQGIAGDGIVLGAMVFILVVYIAFRSGIPLSGIVLLGVLVMGALYAQGLVDLVVFGVVLIIGGLVFWRATMATGG